MFDAAADPLAELDRQNQSAAAPIPPEFSDDALALRFTRLHQDTLRYVAAWGKWLIREPAVWRFDETVHVFDLARTVCRAASNETDKSSVARSVAGAATVAAVERLARADRRHAATVDQWDSDPWLLNTPGGVVDLRTGVMREHRSDDFMTNITAVEPGGTCPTWLTFLDRITSHDTELQAFLQRAAGYSLTGSIKEHSLFFGFGTGANGKGTFLNTVAGIMGGYVVVADMTTFTASPTDRHPADLAMLRGARLVTAQETEEGREWAESRIKQLTGGDPVTARFMRQDFFTYQPQFKLFLIGNHRPGLRNIDEAIRRRLHLIPFDVRIPPTERDPDLPEKLRHEWPGILDWAIDGCVAWQRERLSPPAAVCAATADYISAEDTLENWIHERCRAIGYGSAETSRLFKDWQAWAIAAGEKPGSLKRFSQNMEKKGYRKTLTPGTNRSAFEGIDLNDVHPAFHEAQHERE